MNVTDILVLIIRWLHAIAAVAWVGGGIFYLLVLRPHLRTSSDSDDEAAQAIAREFRGLVTTAIGILIITGVIMSFNRLTSDVIGTTYIIVLAIKVALALYMFYLVRFLRRGSYPQQPSPSVRARGVRYLSLAMTSTTAIMVIGIIVFLLADVLKVLFETGLAE